MNFKYDKQIKNITLALRALIQILVSRGFVQEVTANALLDSIPALGKRKKDAQADT